MIRGGDTETRIVVELRGNEWVPLFIGPKAQAKFIALGLSELGRPSALMTHHRLRAVHGRAGADRIMKTPIPVDETVQKLYNEFIKFDGEGFVAYTIHRLPRKLYIAGRRKAYGEGSTFKDYIIRLLTLDLEEK